MAVRAGVTFELEKLELEGDMLVVSGFWSGVRGLRFVRPTLLSDERRILASLEHKPWIPSVDRPWIAAFPWDGDEVDADNLALAVGSQVTVPLGDCVVRLVEPVSAPAPALIAASASPAATSPAGPAQTNGVRLDDVARERDGLRRRLDEAKQLAAERERRTSSDADELRDELGRARAAAERARDRALEQLAEAVTAREAAIRTRRRMEIGYQDAERAREAAENALAKMRSERDEASAQRDEILLAYRTLRRQLQTERAQEDRDGGEADGEPDTELAIPGPDDPIGVRSIPATLTVLPELQEPRRESKMLLSTFDLWVIRAIGTIAAACFILVLISILRVVI